MKKKNQLGAKTPSVLTQEKLEEVARQIDSILELSFPQKEEKIIIERKRDPKYLTPCRTQYGMNYVSIYEAAKHLKLQSKEIYSSITTGKCVGTYVFYKSNIAENCFL